MGFKSDFESKHFRSRWIPASASIPSSEQIVIVVLHGLGDSAQSYLQFPKELGVANANYLLLEAPDRYEDGYSWYKLEPHHRRDILKNRSRLELLAKEIVEFGFKTQQIYWLGHSQGCLMAFDHVLHSQTAYGGFVGVSGYVWMARHWKRRALRTPCLFTHGTRDRILPLKNTERQIQQMNALGWKIRLERFSKGHSFDFPTEMRAIRNWIGQPQQSNLKKPFPKSIGPSKPL